LANWLTPEFKQAHPEAVDQLHIDFMLTTVEGYTGCAAALKQLDYLKDLGSLQVPTLFVAGLTVLFQQSVSFSGWQNYKLNF